ncbi:hypothetical protein M758_UG158200 [Ceratodon purpureus]|nr:hypothetical protein M758_UG158200 [Ceratodon purpureus]
MGFMCWRRGWGRLRCLCLFLCIPLPLPCVSLTPSSSKPPHPFCLVSFEVFSAFSLPKSWAQLLRFGLAGLYSGTLTGRAMWCRRTNILIFYAKVLHEMAGSSSFWHDFRLSILHNQLWARSNGCWLLRRLPSSHNRRRAAYDYPEHFDWESN